MIPAPLGLALHETRMHQALRQAQRAAEAGEVPVGAVIYSSGRLVGQAWNQTRTLKDPTAHAEILAITQAASAAGDWRLTDSILYVTKEPCPMCAGAIVLARIPRVVFGASDPQTPFVAAGVEVTPGVLGGECAEILREFFRRLREADRRAGVAP